MGWAWRQAHPSNMAKPNFTEHDIRGKVATDMDDIFKSNKLLGHSSIQMTEDYISNERPTWPSHSQGERSESQNEGANWPSVGLGCGEV